MSVSYELDGEVAVITLSRPERFNSVSADLSRQMVEALVRAGGESRAAVITGAGRAFCAGADLGDLLVDYETGGPDLARVIDDRFNPMVRALVKAEVPTVAAVNGVAAGAGLGLALACDLRVFSSSAYLLSAFIGLALIPDTGSTWLLVRHLGLSRAMELTFTNRRLAAAEAAGLGLGTVVDPSDVLARAIGLARELTSGPTPAYVANRQILHGAAATSLEEALEVERATQGRLGTDPLHLEGMRAFIEKRVPDFRR